MGHEQPEYACNYGLKSTLGIGNPLRMLTLTFDDVYQSMQVPFIETCGNALGHEQPECACNYGLESSLGIGNPSRMLTLTISDDVYYQRPLYQSMQS